VQKVYTPEFKREAVRLAQTSGKPIAQVARELGISDTSIHQWRRELTLDFKRFKFCILFL
jgi:transposase